MSTNHLFEIRRGRVVASSEVLADFVDIAHELVLDGLASVIQNSPPTAVVENFERVTHMVEMRPDGVICDTDSYFYYLTHSGFSVAMSAFTENDLNRSLVTAMTVFSYWDKKLRTLDDRFVYLCPSITVPKGSIAILDELAAVDTACLKAIGMMFDPKQTSEYSMARPRLIQKGNTYYVERDGGPNIPVAQSVVQAYVQPHADAINAGFEKELEGYDVDAINAQMIEAIKAKTGVDIATMPHEEVLELMQRLHAEDRTTH